MSCLSLVAGSESTLYSLLALAVSKDLTTYSIVALSDGSSIVEEATKAGNSAFTKDLVALNSSF